MPDSALIAEVSLLSMGFSRARKLARTVVEAFRLCAEQLSYQTHYEFGMRAVKVSLLFQLSFHAEATSRWTEVTRPFSTQRRAREAK